MKCFISKQRTQNYYATGSSYISRQIFTVTTHTVIPALTHGEVKMCILWGEEALWEQILIGGETDCVCKHSPPSCSWTPSSRRGNPAASAPGTAGIHPSDRATASFQSSWRFAPLRWPGHRSYEKSEQGQKQRQDMLDTSCHTLVNECHWHLKQGRVSPTTLQCDTCETWKCCFKYLDIQYIFHELNWKELYDCTHK